MKAKYNYKARQLSQSSTAPVEGTPDIVRRPQNMNVALHLWRGNYTVMGIAFSLHTHAHPLMSHTCVWIENCHFN